MGSELFKNIYNDLIARITRGDRVHLELDQDTLNEIHSHWCHALEHKRFEDLDAIMCVLEHARHPHGNFEELFFITLENDLPSKQIIFTLAASWKHLLERWARAGDRIPMRYLEILRSFLKHQDFEVREWSLRTIDQVGPQGRMLLKDIQNAKSGWKKFINPHAKAVTQLVEMFEKRWGQV